MKNVLKFVISFFVLINLTFANNYNQQMIDAAYIGETQELQRLFETHNLDINYRDSWGWSVIWNASYMEHLDTMDYILKQENVDLNSPDKGGNNLLFLMSYEGKWEVVNKLINAGAKE